MLGCLPFLLSQKCYQLKCKFLKYWQQLNTSINTLIKYVYESIALRLIALKFWEESYLGPVWFVLIHVDSCRTRVDSCWLVLDLCWLVLDSCWLVLIRVDLCWYLCIGIDLIFSNIPSPVSTSISRENIIEIPLTSKKRRQAKLCLIGAWS